MSSRPEPVTPQLLREWGLPDPGDSKKSRGQVIVVGGSRSTPGAVLLAGEAALRVGAGRLGMLVPPAAEPGLGTVMPEAAVLLLPARASDPIGDDVADELESADAVLIGPGFDDPDQTRGTLLAVAEPGMKCLILDAFALGVLPDFPREDLPEALILNPNHEEAGILLGRDLSDDPVADLLELAQRFDAVVNCYGVIAAPDGRSGRSGWGSGPRNLGERRRARRRDHRVRGPWSRALARGGVGKLDARPSRGPPDRAGRDRLPRARTRR